MIEQPFWKNRRVLITGHTGFKGTWLMLWLINLGADVTGISLPVEPQNVLFNQCYQNIKNHIKHYECNISDYEALKNEVQWSKFEVVFHLAAQALVLEGYKKPITTWQTNLMGTLHLLENLQNLNSKCAVVIITTDKVYQNNETYHGYRENDCLGGYDPYSASKAAAEIAVASWRSSFCNSSEKGLTGLQIATARAGNVIGGGDWSNNRIVPDIIRSLIKNEPVSLRNPKSRRPWQHVLEPLHGYLALAEDLFISSKPTTEAVNFGPLITSNRTVLELTQSILNQWPGAVVFDKHSDIQHEATLLHLQIDKAYHLLRWKPLWNFEETVIRTVNWYLDVHKNGIKPYDRCNDDIAAYSKILTLAESTSKA